MKAPLILAGTSICLLGACAPAGVDLAEAEASLAEAAEAYHQAAAALDSDAVVALYTEDGAMMPPNGPDVVGLAAVREQVMGFTSLDNFQFNAGSPTVVLSAGGQMGYSVAEIDLSWTVEGEEVTERLRDVHIWARADDGSWRLVVDVWNSLVPLED
jgi:ketosteroid isomerase-like protein